MNLYLDTMKETATEEVELVKRVLEKTPNATFSYYSECDEIRYKLDGIARVAAHDDRITIEQFEEILDAKWNYYDTARKELGRLLLEVI